MMLWGLGGVGGAFGRRAKWDPPRNNLLRWCMGGRMARAGTVGPRVCEALSDHALVRRMKAGLPGKG